MICAQKLSSEGQEVKKKRSRAAPLESGPRKARSIKFSDEEMEEIKKRAEIYFEGDVSGWIRFAASVLSPNEYVTISAKKKNVETKLLK